MPVAAAAEALHVQLPLFRRKFNEVLLHGTCVTHVSQHVTRYAVIFSKCHRHSQRCDGGGRGFVSGRRSRFTLGGERSSDGGRGRGSTRRKPGGCRRTPMLTVCLVACHATRVTRHDNLVSFIY